MGKLNFWKCFHVSNECKTQLVKFFLYDILIMCKN